jgi:hypothetical protein
MKDLSLRTMEARSWRARQQGGLMDILFGFLLLGICIAALTDTWGVPSWGRIPVLAAVQFTGVGVFWFLQRRYLLPRLGNVRYGERRQHRIRFTRFALAICVALTAALVVLTALSRRLGISFLGNGSAVTVWAVSAAVVLVPIGVVALVRESPRLVLYGGLIIAGEFLLMVVRVTDFLPLADVLIFGVGSLTAFAIGIPIFVRFLQSTPIPEIHEEEIPCS